MQTDQGMIKEEKMPEKWLWYIALNYNLFKDTDIEQY